MTMRKLPQCQSPMAMPESIAFYWRRRVNAKSTKPEPLSAPVIVSPSVNVPVNVAGSNSGPKSKVKEIVGCVWVPPRTVRFDVLGPVATPVPEIPPALPSESVNVMTSVKVGVGLVPIQVPVAEGVRGAAGPPSQDVLIARKRREMRNRNDRISMKSV